METEAIKGEVEICNKAKFDIKKYNFPKRYENDWRIPNRYVYIYFAAYQPLADKYCLLVIIFLFLFFFIFML